MARRGGSVTGTKHEIDHCPRRKSWACWRMEATITILSWWMCTASAIGKERLFAFVSRERAVIRSPSVLKPAWQMNENLSFYLSYWQILLGILIEKDHPSLSTLKHYSERETFSCDPTGFQRGFDCSDHQASFDQQYRFKWDWTAAKPFEPCWSTKQGARTGTDSIVLL